MSISGNKTYQCVEMRDFLTELAKKLKKNSTAWDNHQRMFLPQPGPPTSAAGSPLRTNVLYKHIEVPLCTLQGCTLTPLNRPSSHASDMHFCVWESSKLGS